MMKLLGTLLSVLFAGAAAGGDDPAPRPGAPYVEFDFTPLPRDGEGKCRYTLTVFSADKDLTYSVESEGPKQFIPDNVCGTWANSLRINRWKAEVVDKTKLRVYGRMFNDKLIPATGGKVTSPDLKKEELPKVKNPPKA